MVEDDDDIAAIIAETLESGGFGVDRAVDGNDGLWMAREGDHALIVLDLLLPGMNGFQVCETLRSEGLHTPVLMLTAKVGEYDETDGFEVGADDYLRKPFSPRVLLARVRALLRRAPNELRPELLSRGRVVFDPASRACEVGGESVELTAREGQLLEALLRSDDAPISRLVLLDEVWGHEFDGDPNVVDVYLRYLRRKVGHDVVENVRGLGFRVRG